MGHKIQGGKNYYYIHWKGYPVEDDSWELEENLTKDTLADWERSLTLRRTNRNTSMAKH